MNSNTKLWAYGYLLMTFFLWGSLYVVSKFVLGKLPVFTISFIRFAIAFSVLTIIRKKDWQKVEKKDYPFILLIGGAGYFMAVGIQLLGTKYAGASAASLLNSLNPVTMTLFGALFLQEGLTWKKGAGVLLSLLGVYTIIGYSESGSRIGITLSLLSVVLWSAVSIVIRKMAKKYNPLQITRLGIGIAAIFYFPVCVMELTAGESIQFDFTGILALAYMGIFCTGIAYLLWNKSLGILEAGICSAFYPVQPLVSSGLGALFLNEHIGRGFMIGFSLILIGIFVNVGLVLPKKKNVSKQSL